MVTFCKYRQNCMLPFVSRNSIHVGVSTIVVAIIVVVIVALTSIGGYLVVNYKPSSSSSSSQTRYELTFDQISPCGPSSSLYKAIFIPWYVTLSSGVNTTSKVQPTNSSVQAANSANGLGGSPNNTEYATITFYVPNGQYSYTIGPPNYFSVNRTSSIGSVTINGGNAAVDLNPQLASCGSTVTTTTTSTATG
jgi:hypothetical protein